LTAEPWAAPSAARSQFAPERTTIQAVTALASLVATSQRVGATPARLAKVRELQALLETLEPDEIETAVHYLSGEIVQGRIGIGFGVIQSAAARSPADAPSLSVNDVDHALDEIADIRGKGAAQRRTQALGGLLARATSEERDFLMRLLVGELRQGALEGVMLDAIAAAAHIDAAPVRRAAMYGSLGAVARAALVDGPAALERFQLELFSPVSPMLARTAADTAEALELLGGEAAFEWKMDGARIQVHKMGSEVRIYTRGLNEVGAAIPEIVEAVRAFAPPTLVLDGEAVAFDPAGRPRPFQVTMRRFGRRLNVEALRGELPMQSYFFDCLRVGDRSIADRPTRERVRALAESIPAALLMPRLITSSASAAAEFYDAALAAGHEGLMAKSLDAPYEAGNRGAAWLKIKRAHTLDLVVLAAEWGHGRRTGLLSNLHLGALDPATGAYVMLGKTFKGLTDAMLERQTRELLARETHRDRFTVYVRPELVVEVAFSDLQASSRYPGGLALRLARVKRYRDDKSAYEADDMTSVRRIHDAQIGRPDER
jgi:DNA ligase 1